MLNLEGHTYGRLTVTGPSRPGTKVQPGLSWFCKCTCGNEVWVSSRLLRRPHGTKSCGCFQRENGQLYLAKYGIRAPMKKAPGEAARRGLFIRYQRRARLRSLEWDLGYEEFCQITLMPCDYCGCEPAQQEKGRPGNNGSCTYSGLDRKDNEVGYIPENVVPSCGTCNYAKRLLSVDEFLSHIDRIHAHQEAKRAATS